MSVGSDVELRTLRTNQLNQTEKQFSFKFSPNEAKPTFSYIFYSISLLCRMWGSTFVAETIFRCSIRLLRTERVGRSKVIQTNLTEPDVELFMNLTRIGLSYLFCFKNGVCCYSGVIDEANFYVKDGTSC